MSARADLFHRLVVGAGLSPHWATRQIDAFAHELAEQQRAWADAEDKKPGGHDDSYDNGVISGARQAADLIDPSAGPVRPDEGPTP